VKIFAVSVTFFQKLLGEKIQKLLNKFSKNFLIFSVVVKKEETSYLSLLL
jgi:hypothetical protein